MHIYTLEVLRKYINIIRKKQIMKAISICINIHVTPRRGGRKNIG